MPLSPHRRLILLACRTGPGADAEMHALAAGEVRWHQLLGEARRLELEPLVARRLLEGCGERLPAAVARSLERTWRRNLARNLLLEDALGEIIDLFAREGIPLLPLKGPVLAESAYGHPGLRRIYDLDLLVHRRDVGRAVELLEASGYRATGAAAPDLEGERDLSLVREAVVELGWKLKDRLLRLPEEALWRAAREGEWQGRKVLTLPPELTLLQLVHHLHYHAHPLKVLVDVARFLDARGGEIDYRRLERLAARWRMRRNLHLALEAAASVLGCELPEVARAFCRETAGERRWLRSLILSPRFYLGRRPAVMRADAHLRTAFAALSLDGSPLEGLRAVLGRRRDGASEAGARVPVRPRGRAPRLRQLGGLAAGCWRLLLPPGLPPEVGAAETAP